MGHLSPGGGGWRRRAGCDSLYASIARQRKSRRTEGPRRPVSAPSSLLPAVEVSRDGVIGNPNRVRDPKVLKRTVRTEPVDRRRANAEQVSDFSYREQALSLDQGWTKRSQKRCSLVQIVAIATSP